MTQSKKLSKFKKTVRSLDFFTPETKLVSIKLKQVFVKAPILYYFDPERYIWIKTDILRYIISEILS